MRIAWVLYGGLEQRTGGTIYDALVVEGLRRAGDDVHVASIESSEGSAGLALAARIREIDPDVVVGDELCFRELGIAFERLGAGDRPRRVLLVHHLTAWETELSPERRRAVHAAERLAIDASDALIVTSCTTKERLVREGVSAKIDVVLPGADRLRVRLRESESGTRFVFVGAVVARKRVVELVRAFGRGAHRNGRLAIVGSTAHDPAYVASVRAAIAGLGLGERVVMDGEVDEEGVTGALARADVFVMPSTLEGYGIAATEAIYAGVPVIAARAQGLEEALAPCAGATLFADDEDALASALGRFASDRALRARMTDAARAASSRMPTWSECAERFRAALGVGARDS